MNIDFTTEDMMGAMDSFIAKYLRPAQQSLARKWSKISRLRRAAGVHDLGPTEVNRQLRERYERLS